MVSSNNIAMEWIIIILSSVVIGLLYRANILYIHLNHFRKNRELPTGCISAICFPCIIWVALPIYLFIKMKWWVPLVVLAIGLVFVRGAGYLLECACGLPDSDDIPKRGDMDIYAMLLSNQDYYKALIFLFSYVLVSIGITIFIIIKLNNI